MDKNFVMKELWPVGSRVELHPGTDRWMMGDRFGDVERIDRKGRVVVRLDRSGKALAFHPDRVIMIRRGKQTEHGRTR